MPEEPFALTLPAPQPAEDDYDAVHAAVMETARGRWFLEEYGRRNRSADTSVLLVAIERIEAALRSQDTFPASAPGPAPKPPRAGAAPSTHALHELRDAVMLTKESLPAVDPQGRIAFKPDFGRIPTGIAAAADRMRASIEQVQETAWFLRERAEQERGGLKDALEARCNELEAQARELTLACAQLDQMSEAAAMIAALLAELETRFEEMIAGAPADPAPQPASAAPAPPAEKPVAAAPVEFPMAAAVPAVEEPVAPPRPAAVAMPVTALAEQGIRDEAPEEEASGEGAGQGEMPQAAPAALVDIPPIATTVTAPPVELEPRAAESTEPTVTAEPVSASGFVARDIALDIAALSPPPPAPAAEPQAAPVPVKAEWMDKLAPQVRGRFAPDSGPPAKISFDFDDTPPAAIAMPNPARREMPGADLVPPPVRPEPAVARHVAAADTSATESFTVETVEAVTTQTGVTKRDAEPIPLVMRFEIESPPIAEPVPRAAMPEPAAPELAPEPAPVFRTAVLLPDEKPADDPAAFLFDQMPDLALPGPEIPAANGSDPHEAARPVQPLTPAAALAPIMALSDEEKIALFS